MTRDHSESTLNTSEKRVPAGKGWGLGFAVVKDAAAAGSMVPDGSFYWTGAAKTHFWVDPKNDLVVVDMTQSMDPDVGVGIPEEVTSIVYGALVGP